MKCRKRIDTYEEDESIVTPSQSISTINDSSSSTDYLFINIGSFVHEHGTKIDGYFQCSKCNKSIPGTNGNTSNFKRHLVREPKIIDPAIILKTEVDPFASFKMVKNQQNEKDEAIISFNLSYLHMIAD
jgi:hypothetical protein